MVKQVEDIGAELHVDSLGQFGVFGQGEIKVLEIRANESVAAKIAEVEAAEANAVHRVPVTRRGKSAKVQQLVMAAGPGKWVADDIWPLKELIAVVEVFKRVQVVRLSAGEAQQAVDGPAVGEGFRGSILREIIAEHPGQPMARVKVGVSLLRAGIQAVIRLGGVGNKIFAVACVVNGVRPRPRELRVEAVKVAQLPGGLQAVVTRG